MTLPHVRRLVWEKTRSKTAGLLCSRRGSVTAPPLSGRSKTLSFGRRGAPATRQISTRSTSKWPSSFFKQHSKLVSHRNMATLSNTASSLEAPSSAAELYSSQPVRRVADRLETPALDDRSYRVIRLSNDLEILLVHDPDTDKASAAMDVNVGSFSDRDDMPGMAHAVEHLLFMGTEKVCPRDTTGIGRAELT